MRKSRPTRRGSQAVEFALVLPLLVALAGGILDYGWYYQQFLAALHSTREGGRFGSTQDIDSPGTPCSLAENSTITALRQAGFSTATADQVSGTVGLNATTGERILEVNTELPHATLFGLLPSPQVLRARVVVRLEDQRNAACAF
jgi:Flp pilus assembly protein TadG